MLSGAHTYTAISEYVYNTCAGKGVFPTYVG